MSKPREWFGTQLIGSEPENYIASFNKDFIDKLAYGKQVVLVEKSTYERARSELANTEKLYHQLLELYNENREARELAEELIKERNYSAETSLRLEQALAEYANYVRGKPGEWYITQLQAENDNLKRDLEKYKAYADANAEAANKANLRAAKAEAELAKYRSTDE